MIYRMMMQVWRLRYTSRLQDSNFSHQGFGVCLVKQNIEKVSWCLAGCCSHWCYLETTTWLNNCWFRRTEEEEDGTVARINTTFVWGFFLETGPVYKLTFVLHNSPYAHSSQVVKTYSKHWHQFNKWKWIHVCSPLLPRENQVWHGRHGLENLI